MNKNRDHKGGWIITAIGTPLDERENLHEEGLEAHLADQAAHRIHGILAAGTMGMMPLLTEATYKQLAKRAVELFRGKGEVLVGAGDLSFARTRDRITYLNTLDIDGIAILAPFFIIFDQEELYAYYTALADEARKPVFLYDLPQRTHCKMAEETVLRLAKHRNIAGIKCSDDFALTRQLIDHAPAVKKDFRVIVAQPDLVDTLLHSGVNEQLDGIWAAAPQWVMEATAAAKRGDWATAATMTGKISLLRNTMCQHFIFPSFTVVMNERGIPGEFAPRPYRRLDSAQREKLLAEPIVREAVELKALSAAPVG